MITAKAAAIELTPEEARVAIVKTGTAKATILELKAYPIDAPEAEDYPQAAANAITSILGELKHQPASWTLCLNADQAIIRPITIPFKGKRRVSQAVQFELEPYLAFPIEELLVDHHITAEVDGETDVLALGIRRTIAEEQSAILEEAGITPDAVTLDAVSLAGLWTTTQKTKKEIHAQLFIRQNTTCLTITQGKNLLYVRHLAWPPEHLQDAPQQALRDLQHTFRAFTTTWRAPGEIEQFHILGTTLDPETKMLLTENLPFTIEDHLLINDLRGGGLAPAARPGSDQLNTWEAAIGAAFAAGGSGTSIDFSRNERSPRAAINRTITHLLFSTCLAILLLIGWALYYHFNTSKYDLAAQQLQSRIDTLTQEVDTLSTQVHNLDTAIFNDPTLLDVLKDIATAMPENRVNITEIKLEPKRARGRQGSWISIKGTTSSSAQFQAVFNNLKKSTLLIPDDPPSVRVTGSVTNFTIEAQRYEAPEAVEE